MPLKKGTYAVTLDVGRPGHHYIHAIYKGKRPKGKFQYSVMHKYKGKKRTTKR